MATQSRSSIPRVCVAAGVLCYAGSLAGAFVSGSTKAPARSERTLRGAYEVDGSLYQKVGNVDGTYWNEVGYLPDGTALNLAGNAINHPETIQADTHKPGSELPKSYYLNAVGYLPDGTPLNRAGNLLNHPENIPADPHKDGTPLLPPLKGFVNAIGWLPDGTPLEKAGNSINHA